MKIALSSAELIDRGISFNLHQIEGYLRQAKALGAELVCLAMI